MNSDPFFLFVIAEWVLIFVGIIANFTEPIYFVIALICSIIGIFGLIVFWDDEK